MKSTTLALAAWVSTVLAQTPSLSELIASQSDLSTLGQALTFIPDLAKTVSGLKDITILAPTNAAFESLILDQGFTAASKEKNYVTSNSTEGIAALIAYHVLNGTYASTDFSEIPTYHNSLLTPALTVDGNALTNVTKGQNVGLVLNGKNATILNGDLLTANVVQADITTIPGITIHKIDHVLTIPSNISTEFPKLQKVGVDAAVGALSQAKLVDTVDTVADLTIFVPNNAAFRNAKSALANASIEDVTSLLTYHAIAGAVVFASDITNGSVKTINGEEVTLNVGTDGSVYVDNAKVVLPNILLSNGVAHIIDTVLNPAQENVGPSAYVTPTPVSETGMFVSTDIPFTSGVSADSVELDIPAIATTAKFVTPGGAAAATTTSGGSGSSAPSETSGATASPTVSEFPGAAGKVKTGLSGAAIGLGMALML